MPPPQRPRRRGEFGGRKFTPRRKVCRFCADKLPAVDYKDLGRLRTFLSDRARIEPRRKTGTCAPHQRLLNVALKRARHLALLPYTAEHIRITGMVLRDPSMGGRGRGFRPAEPMGAAPVAPDADGAAGETPTPDGAAAEAHSPAVPRTDEDSPETAEDGAPTASNPPAAPEPAPAAAG